MHALWDGLLGSRNRLRDVDGEVAELSKRNHDAWGNAATELDPSTWADESRALAESFAYSNEILLAVRTAPAGFELARIELPTSYMREAGNHARKRVVMAGVRLAAVLKATPAQLSEQPSPRELSTTPNTLLSTPTPKPAAAHWLNSSSNVRHNSSCKWFNNTKRERFCSATEGKPCGECGG